MASIILDVVIENHMDVHEYAADMASLYDLEVTVLKENGPAGGWPEIKFEGRRKRVEAYVRVYAGHDTEEIKELFALIKE